MGKVVAIEHLTLDGVMQAPGRPDEDTRGGFAHGGWATARSDPEMQQVLGVRMGAAWDLLLGRTTYEDFAGFWPRQARPNMMAEALDVVQKFVASTTLSGSLPWQNSTLLEGDAGAAVAKLKKESAKNLVIFGSGVLLQTLLKDGLVDEYVLQIHPVVLGSGQRLFPDGGVPAKLKLLDSVTTSGGVIIATYQGANVP